MSIQENMSSTPYDDVFRTMMVKSGNLRIPFINEMFHLTEPIPANAPIENMANEYYEEEGDGKQRKIITDSILRISDMFYHVECQSLDDGTILVRMFEYDIGIGLKESLYQDFHLTVRVPYSGVLFLRKTSKTPKQMTVTIETRGGDAEYPVDVMNLADYTLDDLIEKNLLFLFPFYMFNLEKDFKGYEQNRSDARERVVRSLTDLCQYVNNLYGHKEITYEKYLLITDMLRKVTDHLTRSYANVRKELDDIMGGKVLKFQGEDLYNEGKAEGKTEGKINELLGLVYDGLLEEEVAAIRAEKRYGVSKEKFRQMLAEYIPDDEEPLRG